MERSAGILLAISSLPSKYGIGSFSKEAYRFVDWLKAAHQSYWQILPMGPTGYGDSPYQSFSTFAGNPYFIDLDELVEQGLLTDRECREIDWGDDDRYIDYNKIYYSRYQLLRKSYERWKMIDKVEFFLFMEENSHWIYDYSLFMAVKDSFGGIPWTECRRISGTGSQMHFSKCRLSLRMRYIFSSICSICSTLSGMP